MYLCVAVVNTVAAVVVVVNRWVIVKNLALVLVDLACSELFTAEKKYNAAIEDCLDVHKKGQNVVQVCG